jgi:Kef-type K+ transport system membrane component KefB/mannitol/fructose-specific phosphotransferase system IIA component (Ntr-type)
MSTGELMSNLALQIGVILFAVRLGGGLVKKIGLPSVLGELLAGIIIGPYALGGLAFPGFPGGLFPLNEASGLPVSIELYAFASLASVILLFVSGLETDLSLFLRYSVPGGIIGLGGVIFSFALGAMTAMVLLHAPLLDPRCLFMGLLATPTSVGITARILSDKKKMDSPEGVTILAAAVFDDVLGIIALAVILGTAGVLSGGGKLSALTLLGIGGRALGIWLGFTALGLIFSRQFARFLKLFKHSHDFSILALGAALILAGFFEKQGLAMIIGAYIAGLSLSKTDIALVIEAKIRGLRDFFVPLFFAIMGMMVNLREILSPPVLLFGAVYAVTGIFSKVAGCGGLALMLGFNPRGALRIGAGMAPRGEVVLTLAGIALASGYVDSRLFGVVILMTLVSIFLAPSMLSASLSIPGPGTRKPSKGNESASALWRFSSREIARLVGQNLFTALNGEGFYVQIMDGDLSQARKDDIILSISTAGNTLAIETAAEDLPFVKTAVYEVILRLNDSIRELKESADPQALKKEISGFEEGRIRENVLSLVRPELISLGLRGESKEEVITEMVDLLVSGGKIRDRDAVLEDVFQRERAMSTGMEHGVALPHGKSDGVKDICAAVGIKKEGVPFGSLDGEKSRLFIMVVSPKKTTGPHIQFLAAIGAVLRDEIIREEVIGAETREEAAMLLKGAGNRASIKARRTAPPY